MGKLPTEAEGRDGWLRYDRQRNVALASDLQLFWVFLLQCTPRVGRRLLVYAVSFRDQCRPESFKPCIWNNTCQTNCVGAAMHKLPCKEICRPGISPCPIDQMQCYVERTTRKTCFQATHSGHLTPLQCEGSAEDIVEVQCEPTEHYVIYGQTCPQNAEPIMTSWKSKKFDRGLGCRACRTVPGFFAPDKVPGGGSSPSCYFHDDEPVTPLFYSSTCYQAPIRGEADYVDRVLCPSAT